jgi:Ca2+-binding RTX toxin-like protein
MEIPMIPWLRRRFLHCLTPSQVSLTIEPLEVRQSLSANITFNALTGVVTIHGQESIDQASVNAAAPGTISVSLNGTEYEQFASATVTRVDFLGRGGNDQFANRTSTPCRAYGEEGDDALTGGSGGNILSGGAGNDQILGGSAADMIYGGLGNDRLYGGDGPDTIAGDAGDDMIFGQGGDDVINGLDGADSIQGDSGRDAIRGGDGNDIILGGGADDALFGDNGNDTINGQAGNDAVNGGLGDDYLRGDLGDDQIWGEYGNDLLYGQAGADDLNGGVGNDVLAGGTENDVLRGGAGWDTLYGEDGGDRLYGDLDPDKLFGGNGDDRLHGGGTSVGDTLVGNAGRDRFLVEGPDVVSDLSSVDAKLTFVSASSIWTSAEIEVVDAGLQRLFDATKNNALLRDPLDVNGLKFVKETSLAGGALSINRLNTRTTNAGTTYTRSIFVAEWNEANPQLNDMIARTVVHEVGHSWDSAREIAAVRPALQNLWSQFLAHSLWTQTQPANPSLYNRSGDGKWWYATWAQFSRPYGSYNPFEDWSTIWERLVFESNAASSAVVQAKMATVQLLLAELATLS